MSFPRYPKYKPSGVEWLGDVPEHWDVVPIKWLSPVKRGASPRPIDDPKYFDDDGEFAWVRIADVSACDGKLKQTTQRLSQLGSTLSVKILPGELFVSIAGTVGKPCIAAIKACIHDGFVYFPALKIDPRFLYRIFEGGVCYGGLGKLGTQLNLNTDTVGLICVALPPADELNRVLEFLDRETAKIDGLVAEQRRLMELLKEKRQAVITHAVTKGLNPHAPMKPSGIEWLGDVPEHWEIAKTSHFFKVAMGQSILAEDLIEGGEWPVFSATDGDHYFGRINDPKVRLNIGDIVIPARGNSIGFVKLVREPATTTQTTIYCKPLAPGKLNAEFVYQYFRGFKESLFYFTQTAIPQITTREVSSNPILIPPLCEQISIVSFLDPALAKFDTLAAEAQRAIDLLQERRTALIFAAVTGQIDVRNHLRN